MTAITTTDAVRLRINGFRRAHHSPLVASDTVLASSAKKRADAVVAGGEPHPDTLLAGESVRYTVLPPSPDVDLLARAVESVDLWYQQSARYDYADPRLASRLAVLGPETADFARLVWKSTRRIGAGLASRTRADGNVVVATVVKFDPPGNTPLEAAAVNVRPPGLGETDLLADVYTRAQADGRFLSVAERDDLVEHARLAGVQEARSNATELRDEVLVQYSTREEVSRSLREEVSGQVSNLTTLDDVKDLVSAAEARAGSNAEALDAALRDGIEGQLSGLQVEIVDTNDRLTNDFYGRSASDERFASASGLQELDERLGSQYLKAVELDEVYASRLRLRALSNATYEDLGRLERDTTELREDIAARYLEIVEADARFAARSNVEDLASNLSTEYYDRVAADGRFASATGLQDTDGRLEGLRGDITSNYYDSARSDHLFATRCNLQATDTRLTEDFYDRTAVDALVRSTDTALAEFSNFVTTSYYNAGQADAQFATREQVGGVVQTVSDLSDRLVTDFLEAEELDDRFAVVNGDLGGLDSNLTHLRETLEQEYYTRTAVDGLINDDLLASVHALSNTLFSDAFYDAAQADARFASREGLGGLSNLLSTTYYDAEDSDARYALLGDLELFSLQLQDVRGGDFGGDVVVRSNLRVEGTAGVQGDVTLGGALTVGGGHTVLGSNLTVNGDASLHGDLGVRGMAVFWQDVEIHGELVFHSNVDITGDFQASGHVLFDSNVGIQGSLDIGERATFNDDVTMNCNLQVHDTLSAREADFKSNVVIRGDLQVLGTLLMDSGGTGDTTFDSNLEVRGTVTFDSNVTVASLLAVGDDAVFDSNLAIRGQLLADGNDTEALPGLAWASDPATGLYLPSTGVLAVSTGGGERLRVEADGSVGIGTLAPTSLLHVAGDVQVQSNITLTGGLDAHISVTTPHTLSLRTSDTDRLRILSTGQVGIGTEHSPNPDYALDVKGTIHASGDVLMFSDARYKGDIEPIRDVLAKLAGITGVTFSWKEEGTGGARHLGLLAQDVARAFPEAVHAELPSGRLSVAYPNLVGALVEGVKALDLHRREADARLEAQGRRIEILEGAGPKKSDAPVPPLA